jgi:hypothetical protein
MPTGRQPPAGWSPAVVPPVTEAAAVFDVLSEKLNRIENAVARGLWRRQSEPPSADVIANARAVLDRLRASAFRPSGITPSAEGGLGIYFEQDQRYADVEILNSGKVLGVISDRSGKVTAFEVQPSPEGQNQALSRIRAFLVS